RVADWLVAPRVVQGLSEKLLAALKTHHESQPLSEGLPREEARERIFGRASPHIFEHRLAALASQAKIVVRDRLALAGHQVSLSSEETQARDAIERIFKEAGLAPPDPSAVQAGAQVPAGVGERVAI